MPFSIERIDAVLHAANTVVEEYLDFRSRLGLIANDFNRSDLVELKAAAARLDSDLHLFLMPLSIKIAHEIIKEEFNKSKITHRARLRDKRNKQKRKLRAEYGLAPGQPLPSYALAQLSPLTQPLTHSPTHKLPSSPTSEAYSLEEIAAKLRAPAVQAILASPNSEVPRQLEPGEISWSTDGADKVDLSKGDPTLAEDQNDPGWGEPSDSDSDSNLVSNSSNSP